MATKFAVIFDNDGVLVDTESFSEEAYKIALEEQGVTVDPSDAERYCGLTDADILRDMQQRHTAPLDFDRFSERKRELYFSAASKASIPVFPGARDLLDNLRQAGVPVALASSAPREKIFFNLEKSGLRADFEHIVSGEDFERGKPDPEIFLRAAERIGAMPGSCVVIEDSINGLKAARAAGMVGVGVTNTFAADRLRPHADHVIAGLGELSTALLSEWISMRHGC